MNAITILPVHIISFYSKCTHLCGSTPFFFIYCTINMTNLHNMKSPSSSLVWGIASVFVFFLFNILFCLFSFFNELKVKFQLFCNLSWISDHL